MLKLAHKAEEGPGPQPAAAERRHARLPRTRYYAFLSYSHKDEELAGWLHDELEEFRVPPALVGRLTPNGVIPKRLTPIFRDEHDLAASDDLGDEITDALKSSQFLVVLCSPDAARSRWTNAEVDSFKRSRPDGCVLAVIAAGEPFASEMPGREDEECFPPALRERYDRRGRPTGKRSEPLAADLRDANEGRRVGFLKLVAGMLGVGLDELVQRETTRRHRRLAWLSAASLAGMAITSILAVTAIQSRDAARDQRREAEGLVAFMMGDLKDKLEPIGRLDALDGVGSRVLAYYSKQDTTELSDAALLQRARALSLTAQVAYLRGNLGSAEKLYREAKEGTAEAVARSPDDPQRLFDHAQNVFWLGDLARRRGRIDQAETAYREYGQLAGRMVAIEPDNLKWRMEVQYARENLGIVLMSQRRFSEAARQFAGALGPIESMAAIDAGKSEYQLEVSNVLAWLADARRAEGRLEEAIALRKKQISILQPLLALGTTDVLYRQHLVPARRALGLLFTSRGQAERGIEQYRLALTEANQLIRIEPDNSMWRDLAASVQLELARNLLATGSRQDAQTEAARACETVAALRARDPNVAGWRTLQTTCLGTRSQLALAADALPQAQLFAEKALSSARAERSGDPVTDRYSIAAMYRLLGDVRQRMGNAPSAKEAWTAGIAEIPRNAPERPWEMNERAQLLKRVGRIDEARPLVARLDAMGYRSNT